MKYTIFTIAILFQSIVLYAQEDIVNKNDSSFNSNLALAPLYKSEVEKYIYTYSGNLFTGENFQAISENGTSYMKIDSFQIDLSQIQFIKFNNNFWANTNKIEGDQKNLFALRTEQSKLNLYTRKESIKKVDYQNIHLFSNHIAGDYNVQMEENIFNYYNKDFGELKPVNYKNLSVDLSDNPHSIVFLEESQKYKGRSTLLYVVGITSVIYGFARGANIGINDKNESNYTSASFYLPVGIGLSSIWIGSTMSKRSSEMIQKAINSY